MFPFPGDDFRETLFVYGEWLFPFVFLVRYGKVMTDTGKVRREGDDC